MIPHISPSNLILLLVTLVAPAVIFWRIFGKAGFSPYLSLLMALPFFNLFLLMMLAFAPWPSLERQAQTSHFCPNCGHPLTPSHSATDHVGV